MMGNNERFLKEIGKRGAKLHDFELRDYTVGLGEGAHATGKEKGEDSVPLTIGSFIMQNISDPTGLLAKVRKVIGKTKWREIIEVKATDAAGFVKEGGRILTADSTFKSVDLESYKVAVGSVVTNEALADTNFNLEQYIKSDISEKINDTIEEVIVKGTKLDGLSKADFPVEGLLDYDVAAGASETQITDASNVINTLISAYYKLPQKFREQCVLLVSPSFKREMRNLRDTTKAMLLTGGLNEDITKFFGVDIVESKHLDEYTISEGIVAMFVVLDKAVVVNLRGDINVGVKHEVASQKANYKDVTHIFSSIRFDSKLLYHDAISVIKNAVIGVDVIEDEIVEVEELIEVINEIVEVEELIEVINEIVEVEEQKPVKRTTKRKPKVE